MTKTSIFSFLHGIYPRSETLARVSRDFDRNRKSESDLKISQKKDLSVLFSQQKKLGFTYIEDGKLSWQDIFRPIIEATDGMSVGSLTRWFDNNCFFRQPVITKPLHLNKEKMTSFFNPVTPTQKWKVTLPSPFLFAKLAQSPNFSFEQILEQTTAIIKQLIEYLQEQGVLFIQLNEPAIPYYSVSKKEQLLFAKALTNLLPGDKKIKIAVNFYFGDAQAIVKTLIEKEVPIDAVGIDFTRTNLSSLPASMPFDTIAGVLEGRNSLIEKEQNIIAFIKKIIKTYNRDILYITHNSDLDLLPQNVAAKKIELLGKIQERFA